MAKKIKPFILLCGESGSGKTTVSGILETFFKYRVLPSYTTRPRREENEKGHTFVTPEEFYKLTDIVAYTEIAGYKYCGTAKQVEENDIYVIDIPGIEQFQKLYNGDKRVIVVYLSTPYEVRLKRLVDACGSIGAMERIVRDGNSFDNVGDYAHCKVNNVNAYDAAREIAELISNVSKGGV